MTTPQLSSSISVVALHQISEPTPVAVANTANNNPQATTSQSNTNNAQITPGVVTASNPNVVVSHPNTLITASQPMLINHNTYQGQQQPHQQPPQ